jgi:hypothetical protein
MIQEGFPRNEWIRRVADDERQRDAVIAAAREIVARDTAFIAAHGRALMNALAATVAGDVEHFHREFPEDPARRLTIEGRPDEGFVVRRSARPSVELTIAPQWTTARVACQYRFAAEPDLPTRENGFVLVFTPAGSDDARFKHHESGQVFASVHALSEYLLTPLFTGRPRVG